MLGRCYGSKVVRRYVADVTSFLRRIAGMPDYQAYLEHLGRYHPDTPPLSERQFYEEYLKGRYGDGPTRCC